MGSRSGASRSSGTGKQSKVAASLAALDIGRDSKASSFIERVEPRHTKSDLILSPDNNRVIQALIEEFRAGDMLRRHGLELRSKLLFCGPPGCGKTLTTEVFANELGLDLFVVRLDAVISSFLGETAANLRSVIEAAERRPCVLFFDEFDALARTRSDRNDNGEIRRVVNSLLMLIENFSGRGFLVAATNLESSLDPALWRRFDDVMMFERPTEARIKQMLKLKTRNFRASFRIEGRAKELVGSSYAEIDRICTNAIKSAILAKRKKIAVSDFSGALRDEKRRRKIRSKVAPVGL